MPREYKQHLEDIIESISRITDFVKGFSQEDFANDLKTQDAVLRNLQIIGDAAKAIPKDVKIAHPEIEWRKITGLRDIITHQYFGVDFEIIWDVIQNKLSILQTQIGKIEIDAK